MIKKAMDKKQTSRGENNNILTPGIGNEGKITYGQ